MTFKTFFYCINIKSVIKRLGVTYTYTTLKTTLIEKTTCVALYLLTQSLW